VLLLRSCLRSWSAEESTTDAGVPMLRDDLAAGELPLCDGKATRRF
jgi:hypothetical protein